MIDGESLILYIADTPCDFWIGDIGLLGVAILACYIPAPAQRKRIH